MNIESTSHVKSGDYKDAKKSRLLFEHITQSTPVKMNP